MKNESNNANESVNVNVTADEKAKANQKHERAQRGQETKLINALHKTLTESVKNHEKAYSAVLARPFISDDDLQQQLRAAQRELHHIKQERKVLALDSRESRLNAARLFRDLERKASGNDKMKIASLADALERGNVDKLNSGMKKALFALSKLEGKQDISVTSISRYVPHKNNVRTSYTLLCKLRAIDPIKSGQSIIGYSRNKYSDERLNPLVELCKAL